MARKDSFNKTWASNPAQFEKPGDALIERGWAGGASEDPPEAKWENWWHNRLDEALLEIQNSGALAWFPDAKYTKGALVNYGGRNWVALSANSNISPNGPLDNGIWLEVEYSKSDFLKKSQNGADIPDKNAFVKNLGLVETVERAKNTYSKSESDNKFADKNTSSEQTFNAAISATDTIFARGARGSSDNLFGIYCNASREMPAFLSARIAGKWVGELYHPNKPGTLATTDDINVPVGVPLPYPHRYTPAGYLTCNGQTFDKSLYPKLAEAYPDGKVPDLRGEFIRGWDDSRGVDPGRVCGTWQEDAIQGHKHGYRDRYYIENAGSLSGVSHKESSPAGYNSNAGSASTDRDNNTFLYIDSTTERAGGNETRPRNVAFNYIVRAA
ncbi:phage tail protein [Photorhabdus bodei]|uniref:phage tail protein n=1 Tax=Photorhabdus bodei TaxID=2029681 RepID=UPI00232B9B26|nr:phage tail protein [Photorhabdus bodei]MDB6366766.1 phage tail protein [Photorhabdus bodei]